MKSILIVDDSQSIVKMLLRRLGKAGYELHVAENGLEGLKMAFNLKPDLILMDMNMPVMDGHEATRVLRFRGYKGLICALTASASQNSIEKMKKVGCDYCLSKPMEPDFEKSIKRILEGAD